MKFLALKSRITIPQAIAITMLGMLYVAIFTDGLFLFDYLYQQSVDFVDFLKSIFRHWVQYGLSSF